MGGDDSFEWRRSKCTRCSPEWRHLCMFLNVSSTLNSFFAATVVLVIVVVHYYFPLVKRELENEPSLIICSNATAAINCDNSTERWISFLFDCDVIWLKTTGILHQVGVRGNQMHRHTDEYKMICIQVPFSIFINSFSISLFHISRAFSTEQNSWERVSLCMQEFCISFNHSNGILQIFCRRHSVFCVLQKCLEFKAFTFLAPFAFEIGLSRYVFVISICWDWQCFVCTYLDGRSMAIFVLSCAQFNRKLSSDVLRNKEGKYIFLSHSMYVCACVFHCIVCLLQCEYIGDCFCKYNRSKKCSPILGLWARLIWSENCISGLKCDW